jgi:isoleucyl-tRNA synthetase
VDIYCGSETQKVLALLEQELRFVLITSDANVHALEDSADATRFDLSNQEQIALTINKSSHQKCARCWHLRPDVGDHEQHPELCGRCVDNIDGDGETRRYA